MFARLLCLLACLAFLDTSALGQGDAPEDIGTPLERGRSHRSAERWDAAATDFDAALAIDRFHSDALFERAQLGYELNDFR